MRIKMDEYVEREALSNFILGLTIVDPMVAQYADAVLTHIQQAPAADVAPVRHGRWEPPAVGKYGVLCSVCRSQVDNPFVYCPNCGAKMNLEDTKND